MNISLDIEIAPNDIFRVYRNSVQEDKELPLFIFHHGAGYTAHTFSEVIKELCAKVSCSTLAFDARGHGYSHSDNEELELEGLSKDVVVLVEKLFPVLPKEIVLVGHSMGGSVMVNIAKHKMIKNVIGVVVLDVVEGTAIEALPNMNKILRNRPFKFKSLEEAIKWAQRQEQVKNKNVNTLL
jgi:pimeloyl-ACP methyl ester carboxylesterase